MLWICIKSIKLIKKDALFGLIIPNAWLMVYSGQGLRKFILDNCKINEIINLEAYSFENVSVDTIIMIGKKEKISQNEFDILLSNRTEFVFSHKKSQEELLKIQKKGQRILKEEVDEEDMEKRKNRIN